MPFTLNFNSCENTEVLDISVLEGIKYNNSNKVDRIVFDNEFNQPIPKLPAFIKHVEFGNDFNQNITHIGEHIETIIFRVEYFNYNLRTFPKGLKELTIICDHIISKIENINPGLETLSIENENFNDEFNLINTNITSIIIVSNALKQRLHYLPLGLKKLDIKCSWFNSPIDNLPPGLEYIKISSTSFNQQIDNLPQGLKALILNGVDSFIQPLNNLPHGLEIFELNIGYYYNKYVYKHSLENLPNSIKKLSLSNYWGNLNTIVDSVIELDVWFPPYKSKDARIFIKHWNTLPRSLKILNINKEISRINQAHNMIDIIQSNMNINGICVNDVIM